MARTERVINSKKDTANPQKAVHECESCGEAIQGFTGYINHCTKCGEKLDHQMITVVGKHPNNQSI